MKELVDTLVSSGLRDAGYVYFNLDGVHMLLHMQWHSTSCILSMAYVALSAPSKAIM